MSSEGFVPVFPALLPCRGGHVLTPLKGSAAKISREKGNCCPPSVIKARDAVFLLLQLWIRQTLVYWSSSIIHQTCTHAITSPRLSFISLLFGGYIQFVLMLFLLDVYLICPVCPLLLPPFLPKLLTSSQTEVLVSAEATNSTVTNGM